MNIHWGWSWGGKTEGKKASWEAIAIVWAVLGCVQAAGKAGPGQSCDSAICKCMALEVI